MKAIGISEITVEEAKTIQAVVPVSAIEIEWNLFNRQGEVSCFMLESQVTRNAACLGVRSLRSHLVNVLRL